MGWSANSKKNKGNYQDIHLNREMFNKFESRKICVAGYQCDNSDFEFCIAEHNVYDAVRQDFALSASFVLECFDGSEVTAREGNELVVQKEICVVEEIKEVELRSRRGKFIYNRTYNSVGLNQVSQLYFRQDKLP